MSKGEMVTFRNGISRPAELLDCEMNSGRGKGYSESGRPGGATYPEKIPKSQLAIATILAVLD